MVLSYASGGVQHEGAVYCEAEGPGVVLMVHLLYMWTLSQKTMWRCDRASWQSWWDDFSSAFPHWIWRHRRHLSPPSLLFPGTYKKTLELGMMLGGTFWALFLHLCPGRNNLWSHPQDPHMGSGPPRASACGEEDASADCPGADWQRKQVLHSHSGLQRDLSLLALFRRCYVLGTPFYFRVFVQVWIHSRWFY